MNALYPRLATIIIILLTAADLTASPDTLTIVFAGDSHSHLTPGGPRDEDMTPTLGGIARFATFVGMQRMTQPNVIALHSGDFSIGDALYGIYGAIPELKILASIGVSAIALGNHEFDLTPSVLQTQLDLAFTDSRVPILSANALIADTGLTRLRARVAACFDTVIGGIHVGLFGLTTPRTNDYSQPAPVVIDTALVDTARACVAALKARGARVIIMLSHLGEEVDFQVAQTVIGIDVVIGGHDHIITSEPIAVPHLGGPPTLMAHAGAYYYNAGVIQLSVDDTVELVNFSVPRLDANYSEAPEVKAIVDNLVATSPIADLYSQAVGRAMSDITELVTDLDEEGAKDSPLGDLLADAIRASTGTDVVVVPGGNIAEALYQGPLTASDVYRAVGYGLNDSGLGFRLMTVDVPGITLLRGLTVGVSNLADDELLLQTSGMRYKYAINNPLVDRICSVYVGSDPINPAGVYSLAATEFVMAFLEKMGYEFSNPQPYPATDYQVLLNRITASGTLSPMTDGRITAIPAGVEDYDNAENRLRVDATPNPMHSVGTVQIRCTGLRDITVDLVDIRGASVRHVYTGQVSESLRLGLDVGGIAPGVYFCRVISGRSVANVEVRVE